MDVTWSQSEIIIKTCVTTYCGGEYAEVNNMAAISQIGCSLKRQLLYADWNVVQVILL